MIKRTTTNTTITITLELLPAVVTVAVLDASLPTDAKITHNYSYVATTYTQGCLWKLITLMLYDTVIHMLVS